ncbi:hypothetical protein JKP88DRAFT_293443 [Tribonema minus]|uniref:Uncharacterized protein n=1 Tax=Tribonema minus TaxID=303371 RepID=A0A836CN14_9STRA|nr:hypothetical protein JKP88DRAFT_293443 [Tribonema minus]
METDGDKTPDSAADDAGDDASVAAKDTQKKRTANKKKVAPRPRPQFWSLKRERAMLVHLKDGFALYLRAKRATYRESKSTLTPQEVIRQSVKKWEAMDPRMRHVWLTGAARMKREGVMPFDADRLNAERFPTEDNDALPKKGTDPTDPGPLPPKASSVGNQVFVSAEHFGYKGAKHLSKQQRLAKWSSMSPEQKQIWRDRQACVVPEVTEKYEKRMVKRYCIAPALEPPSKPG